MIVYCFDNDNQTENLIKSVIPADSHDVQFYFNEKIANIRASSRTDVVAFIDTRIHGKRQNGFSLALLLREKIKDCHIVFMSDYPEDMAHCFKNLIRPSGFLLKPFSKNEVSSLYNTIEAYIRRMSRASTITISTHECKRIIELDKIIYFSTSDKKIFCLLNNSERIEFYGTISNLEKEYSEEFIRCHSGFLVNKKYIKSVRKNELELFDCEEFIPISKSHRTVIFESNENFQKN